MGKPNDPTRLRQEVVNTEADTEQGAKLPHERDESTDATDQTPSASVQQAYSDVCQGLVNTDARGADGKPLGSQVQTGAGHRGKPRPKK